MSFQQPVFLFLLLPLVAFLPFWGVGSGMQKSLRLLLTALLIIALARPMLHLEAESGVVVAVVDRSKSMPDQGESAAREAIDILQANQPGESRLAVVSYGYESAVEKFPNQPPFHDFSAIIDDDASDLNGALKTAMGLIPRGAGGRLIVFSDGRWTGGDPRDAAATAAGRNIAVDYRLFERDGENLAVSRIDAPNRVLENEGFLINAWVQAPAATTVQYRLIRNGVAISTGSRQLEPGNNRLVFRDRAPQPGTLDYQVQIQSEEDDPVLENNTARFLVSVDGAPPLLLISRDPNSSLADLLRRGGLTLDVRTPDQMDFSLARLSGYAALILENISAQEIGERGMGNISAWVQDTGAGLMTTGGHHTYGMGGWYRSTLEPLLPFSLELRQEHRKLAMAIVVVVDRSGSMGAPVDLSRTKMDLANLAAASVLDTMAPTDLFGHIAVDTRAVTNVPLTYASEAKKIRPRILSLGMGGGGIYVYEALSAALEMVSEADVGTRHVILFSDAADSNQPEQYGELMLKAVAAGITVSVVGLGEATDQDGDLLVDIARAGGGRIYFTNDARSLPRIFAQDTIVVSRGSFVEDPTPLLANPSLFAVTGADLGSPPPVGGYNLCYIKDGADTHLITQDEYKAPISASWFVGSGRVISFTGEASGEFAGDFANWARVGDYFTSMARWAAGRGESLPGGSLLTQEQTAGGVKLTLHLDPERSGDPFAQIPEINVLRGAEGSAPQRQQHKLRWETPHSLSVELPLLGTETMLSTLMIDGKSVVNAPPARLPYSPEYTPYSGNQGRRELAAVARMSGGIERSDLAAVWDDLPQQNQRFELTHYLIIAAMLFLLLEIIERRTHLLGQMLKRKPADPIKGATEPAAQASSQESPSPTVKDIVAKAERKNTRSQPNREPDTASSAPKKQGPQKPAKAKADDQSRASSGGIQDALKRAKQRSGGKNQ